MKIDDFKKIFERAFDDSDAWRRWFFQSVVADDDIYIGVDNKGRNATALLMQPYDMLYSGAAVPTGYISCVATMPDARGHGLASALLRRAMADARERGMAMCQLIPAQPHLFYFYGNNGFSTTFYADRERYTALHTFVGGDGILAEPSFEIFHSLEMEQGSVIMHSREQYADILEDMAIDGNCDTIAVTDADGAPAAMLFATADNEMIKVKSLLARDSAYGVTALAELRRRRGKKPVVVFGPPVSGAKEYLVPRGMARLTNPVPFLEALGARHNDLTITIALHDKILPENDGIYTIDRGELIVGDTSRRPDLDIEMAVLTSILFSSHNTGNIFGIPSRRPYMALMLD